jgi:hypothetical protein
MLVHAAAASQQQVTHGAVVHCQSVRTIVSGSGVSSDVAYLRVMWSFDA